MLFVHVVGARCWCGCHRHWGHARRYLAEVEDSDVKLLLQAFQLSLSCCMTHPSVQMLREQMLARLMVGDQGCGFHSLRARFAVFCGVTMVHGHHVHSYHPHNPVRDACEWCTAREWGAEKEGDVVRAHTDQADDG